MLPSFSKKLPAVLAVLALLVCGCKEKTVQKQPSVDFTGLVKAYTGRAITDAGTVKVEFVTDVVGAAAGEELPSGIVSFSPSVDGSAIWTGTSSLEFVPAAGALKPGKSYSCTVALDKLLGVKDKDLSKFTFPVNVAGKNAELILDYATVTTENPSKASIGGILRLSQAADFGTARAILGNEAEILESAQATEFPFVISGLPRETSDKPYKMKVKDADGFKVAEPAEVIIPGTGGDFRVMGTWIYENDSPYIDVAFSEPCERTSSKDGGVTLDGVGRGSYAFGNNVMRVYFDKRTADLIELKLNSIVQSTSGEKLKGVFTKVFPVQSSGPEVKILLNGNILPDSKNLVLPFKATGLSAVDLSVIKIYESNVLHFLQDNSISGDDGLRRSGRKVLTKTIPLDGASGIWNDYSIDLSGLFNQEPGAIYRIRLSFRQEYAVGVKTGGMVAVSAPSTDEEDVWDYTSPWYYENFIDWDEYDWSDRNDPTKPSYYMVESRFPVVNLLSSNIGIIAKSASSDKLWVTTTDIISASPLGGVSLEAVNYQLQPVGSARTSGDGMAEMELSGKPFVLIARKGDVTGYLKVSDGYEKSLSRFDVGGKRLEKGLKGYVYGERGVWRPGDTLHVTLVLHDKEGRIPDTHPATMDLYSPEGQFYCKKICPSGVEGFYTFEIPTFADDPTGIWNAYIKVGGATFHKALRIETIKPNRLKIDTSLGGDMLIGGAKTPVNVVSRWLTGPPASLLRASISMTLSRSNSSFKGFEGYVFNDPTSTFTTSEHPLWSGRLDTEGKANAIITVPGASDAPGMLNAMVLSTVMEEGGDESFVTTSMPFSPFSAYVGVKSPAGDLETDSDQNFQVAVVSADGKRISGHRLEYKIFKIDWSWWWENDAEELGSYVNGSSAKIWASGHLTSGNSDVIVPLRVNYPDWGRFLVYVKDLDSGHASGMVVYVDWPSYRGRADRRDPDALTMLSFSTDKKSYEAGETATVYIPAAEGGRALVSLENASGVISRNWVSTSATEDTPYKFNVTADMAPNFYIHITLLQPHQNTVNDLPIRMYGVIPVLVSNKDSRLEPVITMADSIHPEEEFQVKVSEKSGKSMTYTLAIVDEGLLDITAFKTPDPWNAMYAREALGVRTFDLFDEVAGAYAGKFTPLGIGGDEAMLGAPKRDNRFNAVVKFLGPFTSSKGGDTHKIKLPMYVGSVRVMVVAGNAAGAYGNAAKSVTVKSPLMVVPTLPRVISSGEKVTLPVNVFALEDGVKNAKVTVTVDGPVVIDGASEASVSFANPGDEMVHFALSTVGEGFAHVTVSATGGGQKTSETINIEVRNPNPSVVNVRRLALDPGASGTVSWEPFSEGKASLSLMNFPAIDFDSAFEYVSGYQYNCSEQISARGTDLVFTLDLLSKENSDKARELIPVLLQELYSRQLADGGFAYWPGYASADTWVTSMAGVFMTEAKARGFEVGKSVLSAWSSFQKKAVQNWRKSTSPALDDLDQAYRLYSLAVAGSADNASMNRLKESGNLSPQAARMLASAYAVAGKKEVAKGMLENLDKVFEAYKPDRITYGSSLRDKAMAVEALALIGDTPAAVNLAADVAEVFSRGWYSTQELAFASIAMKRLHDVTGSSAIDCTVDGKSVSTPKSLWTSVVDSRVGRVEIANKSAASVYASLVTISKPVGPVAAESSGLRLKVSYQDADGKDINPSVLRQGDEFTAIISVTNGSLSDDVTSLALTQMVPSGWEIRNERLLGSAQNSYTYNDIRDDRNIWYFDLPLGSTKTFKTRLRAAYEGEFVLPSIKCEAMYSPTVYARSASSTARVTK